MKKFTLQLEDVKGNVEEESEVTIGDNDTLIMQFPESMDLKVAHQSYMNLRKVLEDGGTVGMLNTISFKIIKSQKD